MNCSQCHEFRSGNQEAALQVLTNQRWLHRQNVLKTCALVLPPITYWLIGLFHCRNTAIVSSRTGATTSCNRKRDPGVCEWPGPSPEEGTIPHDSDSCYALWPRNFSRPRKFWSSSVQRWSTKKITYWLWWWSQAMPRLVLKQTTRFVSTLRKILSHQVKGTRCKVTWLTYTHSRCFKKEAYILVHQGYRSNVPHEKNENIVL